MLDMQDDQGLNLKNKKDMISTLGFMYYILTDTPKDFSYLLGEDTETYTEKKGHLLLTEDNWEEVAESRRVDLAGEDNEAAPLIELVKETESFRFATLDNFSVILGKPKNFKSTFVSLLLSELIKSNPNESSKI
jgi:hypothetical protein